LLKEAARAAEAHRLYPSAADHKSNTRTGTGRANRIGEKQAQTQLFRGKRAKTIAMLLGIRRNLQEAGLSGPIRSGTAESLGKSRAKNALRQLVRPVKAEHVGVDMMDIIICGAVAPYNVLLGASSCA
jgi:hypothetical protein